MTSESHSELQLFSLETAGRLLGGISPWTLRKHVSLRNVKVTRIGRRVFLAAEEVERIRREGLPSLAKPQSEQVLAVQSQNEFHESTKT